MSNVIYENRLRVLAIDPGSNHTGFSIIDTDVITGEMHVLSSATYHRKDLVKIEPWLLDVYSEREVAVRAYGRVLHDLLRIWQPNLFIAEAAYMGRFAAAFKALTELLTTFRYTLMEWDSTVPFDTIEPSAVKLTMGVNGGSKNKGDMTKALIGTDFNISYHSSIDFQSLDEHAIDSICIGIHAITNMLQHEYR